MLDAIGEDTAGDVWHLKIHSCSVYSGERGKPDTGGLLILEFRDYLAGRRESSGDTANRFPQAVLGLVPTTGFNFLVGCASTS